MGYLNAYGSISSKLRQVCHEIIQRRKVKEIEITGHSMGAALCAINALDFKVYLDSQGNFDLKI